MPSQFRMPSRAPVQAMTVYQACQRCDWARWTRLTLETDINASIMQIYSCEIMTYSNMPIIYDSLFYKSMSMHYISYISFPISLLLLVYTLRFCNAMPGRVVMNKGPSLPRQIWWVFFVAPQFALYLHWVSSIVPLRFFPFSFCDVPSFCLRSFC